MAKHHTIFKVKTAVSFYNVVGFYPMYLLYTVVITREAARCAGFAIVKSPFLFGMCCRMFLICIYIYIWKCVQSPEVRVRV